MKTLNTLIFAVVVGLMGTGSAMAEEAEFKFPEISNTLQVQIDKKMAASLQQKTFNFPQERYVAKEQAKSDKAS
jgi:hypothetical protein